MKTAITRLLTISVLMFATSLGHAADVTPSATSAPDKLAAARTQIAAKNWPAALDELRRVNDTGDADWNNLMGYSLRKSPTPDFAGAEKFYNVSRLAVSIEAAPARAGDKPSGDFVLSGHCVKLW